MTKANETILKTIESIVANMTIQSDFEFKEDSITGTMTATATDEDNNKRKVVIGNNIMFDKPSKQFIVLFNVKVYVNLTRVYSVFDLHLMTHVKLNELITGMRDYNNSPLRKVQKQKDKECFKSILRLGR